MNNSSATVHDFHPVRLHTTPNEGCKQTGSKNLLQQKVTCNWAILEDVNGEWFNNTQIIMDQSTSGGNIACDVFPKGTDHLLWQPHC